METLIDLLQEAARKYGERTALSVGALFPLIDLGRPDCILNLIRYGRWQSPSSVSFTGYRSGRGP